MLTDLPLGRLCREKKEYVKKENVPNKNSLGELPQREERIEGKKENFPNKK
jgi:hypothetical protein